MCVKLMSGYSAKNLLIDIILYFSIVYPLIGDKSAPRNKAIDRRMSMNENQQKLVALMREMFQLDQQELDFGIYRLMNNRRDIVNCFIDRLPAKIDAQLQSGFTGKTSAEIERLKEEIQKTGTDTTLEEDLKASLIASRKKKIVELEANADIAVETDSIYEHLIRFFKLYYNNGDFISQRKYGKDQYAIPYAGEEVKLYWANADQYYIKTTENFNLYTFDSGHGRVNFRIVNMNPSLLPKNNNKELEKRFVLVWDQDVKDEDGVTQYRTLEVIDSELYINFYYEASQTTQKECTREALELLRQKLSEAEFSCYSYLLNEQSGSSQLEKKLNDYIARNTFDYFIHKNLNGFLTRELDNYIKNEILSLDDILSTDEKRIAHVEKAKTIRSIAIEIIDFLATLENFQKKLWEKKKFVYETNYCITLDRIPESFYAEIAANDAQCEEWVKLFAIDEITAIDGTLLDAGMVAYSAPLTFTFLKQNLFLVLDTAFFDVDFKERLLETIDGLDEKLDGLMIHSENYQALNLLSYAYKGKLKCCYIDPPYNAKSSEILYKNNYKHSSWLSLMENRLMLSKRLMCENAVSIIAIDEIEQTRLGELLRIISPEMNSVAVTIIHNPSGQQGDNFSFTNEFAYFVYPDNKNIIGLEERAEEDWDKRTFRDNSGNDNLRTDAANCFYPILVKDDKIIGFGDVSPDSFHPQKNIILPNGIVAVYPIDNNQVEKKWVFERGTVVGILDELWVTKVKDSIDIMRTKKRFRYKTTWTDKKYSANSYGSALLTAIGIQFSYPKSIYNVQDCIDAGLSNKNKGIVIDYFAGSGTTGHAVINLNREDNGHRKYILVEMGEYFNTVTKPRIEKIIYSMDTKDGIKGWKDGKPVSRRGSSHALKYIRLEGYEDALNNLPANGGVEDMMALAAKSERLMLQYLFDYDTRGGKSLLSIDDLNHPFDYEMQIVDRQQYVPKVIDLVETFNYLIGLTVEKSYARASFDADFTTEQEVLCAKLKKGATYQIKAVTGTNRNDGKTLVIWRNIEDGIVKSNAVLDAYLARFDLSQFDTIYVNGSYSLPNERNAKIRLTDAYFFEKMFGEQ